MAKAQRSWTPRNVFKNNTPPHRSLCLYCLQQLLLLLLLLFLLLLLLLLLLLSLSSQNGLCSAAAFGGALTGKKEKGDLRLLLPVRTLSKTTTTTDKSGRTRGKLLTVIESNLAFCGLVQLPLPRLMCIVRIPVDCGSHSRRTATDFCRLMVWCMDRWTLGSGQWRCVTLHKYKRRKKEIKGQFRVETEEKRREKEAMGRYIGLRKKKRRRKSSRPHLRWTSWELR